MLFKTPVGTLTLGYIDNNLRCEFGEKKVEREPPKKLVKQLEQYLHGEQVDWFDVNTPDGPPFVKKCWEACRSIPYGKTISYKNLATKAGSPRASRAAGQAMRMNPLTILTPCHRVIASNASVHGYAGSTYLNSPQLKRKMYLLNLECE